MAEPIDPALARKLDAFTVPPLPSGFAERLAQKAASMPDEVVVAGPLPRARRSMPRRRWRVATTGLGAIAFGLMSISAAAAGWFGEPLREAVGKAPVVGPAIVRTVERVVPARLVVKRPQAIEPALAANPDIAAPSPSGSAGAEDLPLWLDRAERQRILADPEARRAWMEAHPRAAVRIRESQAARRDLLEARPLAAERIRERQAERRDLLEAHPRAAEMIRERRAAREAGATAPEMRALRREQVQEVRKLRAEMRPAPQTETPVSPPAARMLAPSVEPAASPPAVAGAGAPETGTGPELAQRRLERRERRQERRERRRQRIDAMRP